MALAGTAETAMACTGIYVGSEVSDDGTVMIARSSDNQAVWGNHVTVTERVENEPGRTMPVDMECKVMAELPDTTYKYTATPFFESTMSANNVPNDATACTNEYGVAMTMAVTAFANAKALKADPLIESGLTENTATDLVVCQSKTAREAAEVLTSLIDKYGSSEGNIALIADQNEAWYVEMYTGHQYAAVKLPADAVSVFGNEYSIEYLSEYEDSIVSKDLESLPKKAGFAVYGEKNELNLFETYSGHEVTTEYCHMRTWIGHQVLAPSQYGGDYNEETLYPLCFKPDKKVSLADVCALLRNRFEGTQYDPDETGRIDMRVIGTDTAMSVHVLQVYKDLPAEMSALTWESTGPAIYGVFVPVSNAATSISSAYGKDQPAKDAGVFDADNYPYYAFKELTTLCVDRDKYKTYGKPVRDYWNDAEKGMFKVMPEVLSKASELKGKAEAAEYITAYCNDMQTQAFEDARHLVNDVMWTESKNSNTMKLGRNPETGEVLDKERVLPPMEVSLDPSVYGQVPDVSKAPAAAEENSSVPFTARLILGIVILAMFIALALIGAVRRKRL